VAEEVMSTLFARNGTVMVDVKRCPRLHRALVLGRLRQRADWAKVLELRQAGEDEAAERLVRRILGVKGPAMSEEKKAELRAYKEAHKEEIKQRQKQRQEVRRRTLALLKTGNKGRA
jgi:hypothetical protein